MTTLATDATTGRAGASAAAKYQVLAGALVVQLILGTIYGYSIFWQPLGEALPPVLTQAEAAAPAAPAGAVIVADAAAVAQAQADRQANLKYSFAICLLAFAITMIFAGRMQDAVGPRLTAFVGAVLLAIGFAAAGLFGKNMYVLWLTIGLIAGMGVGFAYVCPIAALVKWFPQHKGLVSGVAVAGFGLGAYFFSQKWSIGATGYIASHTIHEFFLVHAAVCFVAVSIGAWLLRNPPAAPAAASGGAAQGDDAPTGDLTWRQTLRTGRFYLVWLMFFSGAMAGLMVIGILKPFAGSQLVNAAEAAGSELTKAARSDLLLEGAMAVGVLAIFNAIGRVAWGFLSDRIGRTLAMTLMFALQGVTLLVLASLDTKFSLGVGAAFVGFNFGGNFALFPSLTADLFGSRYIGANYGWVFTSYGVAGVIGVSVGNWAYARTDSYFAAFAIAAGLCFLSAVLAIGLSRASRKTKTA